MDYNKIRCKLNCLRKNGAPSQAITYWKLRLNAAKQDQLIKNLANTLKNLYSDVLDTISANEIISVLKNISSNFASLIRSLKTSYNNFLNDHSVGNLVFLQYVAGNMFVFHHTTATATYTLSSSSFAPARPRGVISQSNIQHSSSADDDDDDDVDDNAAPVLG